MEKKISTALIECLNSQIRDNTNGMRRRSKRKFRGLNWAEIGISGFRFLHNFLKAHWSLSVRSSKNWIKIPATPAMIAGILPIQPSIEAILRVRKSTLG